MQVIDQPEAAIEILDMITREEDTIGVDELGVSTILIEALGTGVERNRTVSEKNVIHRS